MTQTKFTNLADASEDAIKQSKKSGYAMIILSKGEYFVESEPGFIRVWEEQIAEYENGNLLK